MRRLESQLAQQKVSHERQVKEFQDKMAASPSPAGAKQGMSAEQAICTMQVEKLTEQLAEEVSALAFVGEDAPPQDWRIIGLVQQAAKHMGETIERLMCAADDSEGMKAARQVFKQLDTRLHLGTAQL